MNNQDIITYLIPFVEDNQFRVTNRFICSIYEKMCLNKMRHFSSIDYKRILRIRTYYLTCIIINKIKILNIKCAIDCDLLTLCTTSYLSIHHEYYAEFPSEIAYLLNLINLQFFHNKIPEITQPLCMITTLTRLNLSNNKISTIPDYFNRLINLQFINLNENQITSIAPLSFKYLLELKLSHNNIIIFPSIDAPKLKILDVSNNHILYIPSIIYLPSLTHFIFADNLLNSLPNELFHHTTIESLSLEKNHIRKIPDEISNLINLKLLKLGENFLTSIPASIQYLTNLSFLDISNNKIVLLPPEVTTITTLKKLTIYNTDINILPVDFVQEINIICHVKQIKNIRLFNKTTLFSTPFGNH